MTKVRETISRISPFDAFGDFDVHKARELLQNAIRIVQRHGLRMVRMRRAIRRALDKIRLLVGNLAFNPRISHVRGVVHPTRRQLKRLFVTIDANGLKSAITRFVVIDTLLRLRNSRDRDP